MPKPKVTVKKSVSWSVEVGDGIGGVLSVFGRGESDLLTIEVSPSDEGAADARVEVSREDLVEAMRLIVKQLDLTPAAFFGDD